MSKNNEYRIEMNIIERLSLIHILPTESNIQDMLLIGNIIKKIQLSENEKKEIEYKQSGETQGRIILSFNKEININKNISFIDSEILMLKKLIKDIDKNKKINMNLLSIALKINEINISI